MLGDLARGSLWAAFAVLIWSGSLVLLRLGVTTNLNAYDLTALRFGTAGLLLIPVIITQGFAYDRLGTLGLLLTVGGFGAGYIVLISQALTMAPTSAAGAINPGIMAVSSLVIAWLIFGERPTLARCVGGGFILTGAALLVFREHGSVNAGHIIFVVTGVMWAGYAATVRKAKLSALHATAIIAVGSAIFYVPVYLWLLPKQITSVPWADILLQTGFQGVLVSILTIFAFNRSTELLGLRVAATLPALIPVVTLVLATLVLGEQARATEILAALITGCGVALVLAKSKEKSSLKVTQSHDR